jgi:hypothetical protein
MTQLNTRQKSGKLAEVSKTNPCPHCGKPDWCYSLNDLSVCNRDYPPASGWEASTKQDRNGHTFYIPIQPKKEPRPKFRKEFVYFDRQGKPLIKVTRSDDGNGGKKFFQSHWDGKNWQKGLSDEARSQVPVYRYPEIKEAITANKKIFWVEGEDAADLLWELGLPATTTLGGSKSYSKYGNYKNDLEGAEIVICPDRDKPGVAYAEEIYQDYPQSQWLYAPPNIFFWQRLPDSGGLDIADWIRDGATVEQIMVAIQDEPLKIQDRKMIEENSLLPQRNHWNAPQSWLGELGWWTEPNEEKDMPRRFIPKTNFDFEIERELSDSDGGGLVIQCKRSVDTEQKRVIIRSTDYTTARTFIDALKKVYGAGIICNLKTEDLSALIQTKLIAYRDRGGEIFTLADRRGQQENGIWSFSGYQLDQNGEITTEEKTLVVDDPNLGGEDKIPSPKIATPDIEALPGLITAMLKFHGESGILPAMMLLGAQVMGLHYQEIMHREGRFPLVNAIGDPGTNKTVAAANALSLVGLHNKGLLHRITISSIYETLKRVGGITLWLDDPERSRDLDELLKGLYNGAPRRVRGNFQEPHSALGICSNHACGDSQPATLSRLIQIPFFRSQDGDRNAWDEMQAAMKSASGTLPQLIKIGYPAQKIRELANEMRPHLPHAHGRLADSLGLITYYTMAVAKIGRFDPARIKHYVINTLCKLANDADSAADSLSDFIEKLNALHSQSRIGEWDIRVVENAQIGRAVAVSMTSVWEQMEKTFKPIYSRKVIEALVQKHGGIVKGVAKFHRSEDESKSYRRLLLQQPREDKDGNFIPVRQPEMVTRRCLLIPAGLVNDFIKSWDSSEFQNNESVTSSVTPVTSSYAPVSEKCNQQNIDSASILDYSSSSVTFLENKDKNNFLESEDFSNQKNQSSAPISLGNSVTEAVETPEINFQQSIEQLHNCCNLQVTEPNQDVTDGVTKPNQEETVKLEPIPSIKIEIGDEVAFVDKFHKRYNDRGIVENVVDNSISVKWDDGSVRIYDVEKLRLLTSNLVAPE